MMKYLVDGAINLLKIGANHVSLSLLQIALKDTLIL